MVQDKIPPQSIEAEEVVIGVILSYPKSIHKVISLGLKPEMFYKQDLQSVYKICTDIVSKGGTVDLIAVINELRKKGIKTDMAYLTELSSRVLTDQLIDNMALLIKQTYLSRQLIQIGNDLVNSAYTEDFEKAEAGLQKISDIFQVNSNFNPEKYRINFLAPPQDPPAVIFTKKGDKLTASFTLQNFSVVIGKAKAKKTFLAVLIIAVYLGYKIEILEGDPERRGIVLWFDTEQSPYHLHRMINRILSLIGDPNPQNLMAYGLKTMTPEEKVKFIEHTIKNTPGVRLVCIDGIRDCVYDINSPEEATKTSVLLMKWAVELDIHILNILHQNKGDNNARGHLGTELTNKAETVLSVTVEGDKKTTTVEAEYCRDIDFKSFSFIINDNSLPELCETPATEAGKSRTEPNFIPNETHRKILEGIFKTQQNIKYREICIGIKLAFADSGIFFGDNRSRDYLAFYIKDEWVRKDEKTKSYEYTKAIF